MAEQIDITRWHSGDNQIVGSSVPVVSKWLCPGNRTFSEVASMVVTWWIVAFLHSARRKSTVMFLCVQTLYSLMIKAWS